MGVAAARYPSGMVRALGYSISEFDPADPGRLCRGRERWIDSFPIEEGSRLHRVSVSGATFSDDSARDARRGLRFSGVNPGAAIFGLFPGKVVVAWCEDGHPRLVPEDAEGTEYYTLQETGGALRTWRCRWAMVCDDADKVDEAIAAGADVVMILDDLPESADGLAAPLDAPLADGHLDPQQEGGLPEEFRSILFLLSGHRVAGSPVRSFQAAAIPDVLKMCDALVLVHLDKHAACLGIYTTEALNGVEAVLQHMGRQAGALIVPFAIPPMLARWDRALWEVRQDWDEATLGEYPVPPATDGAGGWARRGPRGGYAYESYEEEMPLEE